MLENNLISNLVEREISVTEISRRIKELLENNFGYIRVKGEISGLKVATSGHGYFNLKENTAILACTCWRPVLAKIKFSLVNGMEVVVRGKLSGYAGNSRYQLSVEIVQQAGLGAMMQILSERKEKLQQEGIFDKLKTPLPFLPNRIGVITSITGAVIQDIIHRINDRCPSHILIWPVTVQGENAASSIVAAVDGFNQLAQNIKPDVIIVARGGGSIEDLWAFNEEIVVRSVFNSKIPVISAVGHEVDNTLIDLVADKRAPTPTAAAEFVVPVISNLTYMINSYNDSLLSRINQMIKYHQQAIGYNTDVFKSQNSYIEYNQQHLDEVGFKLADSLPNLVKYKTTQIDSVDTEKLNPLRIVDFLSIELAHQFNYMLKSVRAKLNNCAYLLNLNNSLLASLDYKTVLKRGFTMIKSENGEFITSKSVASTKRKLIVKFFDGDIIVNYQALKN